MRQLEVSLTSWQRNRLAQLRDHPPSPRVGRRAAALLLSADRQPGSLIVRATGLSRDGITDIRRRWRERQMRSLVDRRHPGRPPRATDRYRRELRRALRLGPRHFGYVLTVWSIARLAEHLRRVTDIRLCGDRLRRIVHEEGFIFGRPKHTLKGKRDERVYGKAKGRLRQLKKGPQKRTHPLNCGTKMKARCTCIRT